MGAGWEKDKSFSFIYSPNPKVRILHLGLKPPQKTQKTHSPTCLGSPTWCHQCSRVHQQHMNSHCMHHSSSTEAIPENCFCKGKGADPALFSVSPWKPLSPPSGCHIRERSCHLSGLTQASKLLGRSHSSRDWRISSCTPPFWNLRVFSFHTKKTKRIWPGYTLKIGNQED